MSDTPTENPPGVPGLEVTESKEYHLLPVETRAQLALASSKTEADLIALAAKHQGITQIVDKAGREQAHGAAMELMRARTTVVNVSKAAREDATKFSKAVIAEEARLVAIVEPEEKRLKDLRDAWDLEQQRLKREAEERERQRLLAIAGRINEIKGYATLASQCRTSAGVQGLVDRLRAAWMGFNFEDDFQEFGEEAQRTYDVTMATVEGVLRSKQEAEAEAQRLADERAAQERVRLAQEERQRELDAQAAELARQMKAIDDAKRAEEAPKPAATEFGVNCTIQPNEAEKNIAARAALDAVALAPPLILATETTVIPLTQVIASQSDMEAQLRGDGSDVLPPGVPLIRGEIGVTGPVVMHAHTTSPVVDQKPLPVVLKNEYPSDEAIIGAIALHFRVHESKVIEWLLAMDLQAASARLCAEFS